MQVGTRGVLLVVATLGLGSGACGADSGGGDSQHDTSQESDGGTSAAEGGPSNPAESGEGPPGGHDETGESRGTGDATGPDGETTGQHPGETDGESESSGEGTTGVDLPPDAEGNFARGITLTRVTLNQGIESWVYDDGSAEAVSYPLVSGRPALLSVGWRVEPDFVPRNIRAVLTLRNPEGQVIHQSERMGIVAGSSSSDPLGIDEGWILEPQHMAADVTASLALLEMPGVDGPTEPPAGARLPAALGTFAALPVADVPARLNVVVVPLRHQRNGCSSAAPEGPAVRDAIRAALEAMYPVQGADVTMHDMVNFTEAVNENDFENILTFLAELRAAETPAPNTFYYGLIDPCSDSCNGGLGGQAYSFSSPGSVEAAPWRVGVGRICPNDLEHPEFALDTVQHELGHNLGRQHVACAGTEADPDPNYPHAGGRIAGWGVDAQARMLVPPTAPEIMSYCFRDGPRWISGYGWLQVYDVIRELTGLAASELAPSPPLEEVLMVSESGSGEVVTRLVRMPMSGGDLVVAEYLSEDGMRETAPALSVRLSETGTRVLLVAKPRRGVRAGDRLTWGQGTSGARAIALPAAIVAGHKGAHQLRP